MALFKYLKCTEGHRETPPSLTTNDIKKANESIAKALEVKGGQFFTYQWCPSVLVHVETPNAAVNFIQHAHHCKHKCIIYK